MSEFWTGQVVVLTGTLLITLVGVWGALWGQARQARRQKHADDLVTLVAHLRIVASELQENYETFFEMHRYLSGPPIPSVLDVAEVVGGRLSTNAWDDVRRTEALRLLSEDDQVLFGEAARKIKAARRAVETKPVVYRRALQWDEWAKKELERGELVQRFLTTTFHREMQQEIVREVEAATPAVEAARTRITALLDDLQGKRRS